MPVSDMLFIFGAKYLVALSVIIPAVFLFFSSRTVVKNVLVLAVVSVAFAFIAGKIVGLFYYDPLPFVVGHFTPLIEHAADNGFPSDHMLLASVLAMVALRFNTMLGIGLGIIAVCVGISRIE